MKKIRVGLLFGGASAEHEVSIRSARAVLEHLDRRKYQPVLIYITPSGRWIRVEPGVFDGEMPSSGASFLPWEKGGKTISGLQILFPVLHGPYGEDGRLQGMLEMAGIPFVGAGSFGSALAMNKYVAKKLFTDAGLRTPEYMFFQDCRVERAVSESERALGYPLFVKPCSLGSSVGISRAVNRRQLQRGIESALDHDDQVLVERYIDNHEIEICVIGNDRLSVSPPGEIQPHNEFYDYEDKYLLGKTRFLVPAPVRDAVREEIEEAARTAYRALFLQGFARVDFLVDRNDDTVYVNEVNTIPGFTSISMFPRLWQHSGLPFTDLVTRLIELGFDAFSRSGSGCK